MDDLDVRLKIEKEVYKWCVAKGRAFGVMGTIQALGALGYIDLSDQSTVQEDSNCVRCGKPFDYHLTEDGLRCDGFKARTA